MKNTFARKDLFGARNDIRNDLAFLNHSAQITSPGRSRNDLTSTQNHALIALADESSDGIVLLDETLRVRYLNESFSSISSLSEKTCLGMFLDELVQHLQVLCSIHEPFPSLPITHDLSHVNHLPTKHEPKRTVVEFLVPRKIRVTVSYRPLDNLGHCWALFLNPISTTNAKADDKDHVTSAMSHALRTPLSNICGYLEFLQTCGTNRPLPQEMLSVVYRNSMRIVDILDNLKILDHVDALKTEKETYSPVELPEFAADVIANFKVPEGRKPPRLTTSTSRRVLLNRECATIAIHQVLNNAYRFSQSDSEIVLETVVLEASDGVHLGGLRCSDHGIGMSPKTVKHVGERFFVANRNNRSSGTGLGLSIVKEIMRQHQGRLDIDSVLNQGTQVQLLFPLYR